MAERTIEDAARVLMAHSLEAASAFSKLRISSPLFPALYTKLAGKILASTNSGLTGEERALIARFMMLNTPDDDTRSFMLRVRLTENERAELQHMADEADMDMSEFVRSRLFGSTPMVPADAEWWRAATAHEIVNALGVLRNANRMSPVEYKREQERAYNLRAAHDDAALMEMLRQYAPDDPHVNNYPG